MSAATAVPAPAGLAYDRDRAEPTDACRAQPAADACRATQAAASTAQPADASPAQPTATSTAQPVDACQGTQAAANTAQPADASPAQPTTTSTTQPANASPAQPDATTAQPADASYAQPADGRPATRAFAAGRTVRAASTGPAPAGAPDRAEGPARRSDDSVVGQLNAEWIRLCADPSSAAAVERWRIGGVGALSDLEAAVRRDADGVLLALLRLGRSGDALASRSVLQLMLGKAVRIAAGHVGRDSRASLEQAAVTALWTVVAGYPVERRPVKVAANIAMDTLRLTVDELAYQRHETPADPERLHAVVEADVPDAAAHGRGRPGASDATGTAGSDSGNRTAEGAGGRGVDRTAGTGRAIGAAGSGGASGRPGDIDPVGVPGSGDGPGSAGLSGPPDLELYELLAWAVGNATISRDDALLLVDIYAPAPGCPGGKAAAERRGISWAAARQRASRATRRIAEAVRADGPTAGR